MASLATLPDPSPFGLALRDWRRARGMSQLDLALSMDISPRHLSFLETGRAQPSREMAHRLAEALLLPRSEQNALLQKAGYAASFPVTPLDAQSLAPLKAVLSEMMERHAPNPALLCDRRWTVLDANITARALLSALHSGPGEMNVARMLTDTDRAAENVENLGEVLMEMAGRIRLEALEAGADPFLEDLLTDLEAAMRRVPPPTATAPRRPLAPLVLRAGPQRLSFLSAIAQFGTSEDVTVRDLRLELLFPADDETRATMAALASAG